LTKEKGKLALEQWYFLVLTRCINLVSKSYR
jgi:hypothetical protein